MLLFHLPSMISKIMHTLLHVCAHLPSIIYSFPHPVTHLLYQFNLYIAVNINVLTLLLALKICAPLFFPFSLVLFFYDACFLL